VNPLAEITDPSDPRFVATRVTALVNRQGTGPATLPLSTRKNMDSVRIYVACSPASHFSASVGKGFDGRCASRFQNFADIPLGSTRDVKLVIPKSTSYSILVIPSPSQ